MVLRSVFASLKDRDKELTQTIMPNISFLPKIEVKYTARDGTSH